MDGYAISLFKFIGVIFKAGYNKLTNYNDNGGIMSQDKSDDDVCEACGSFVELGSVISEDDTVLVLPFTGEESQAVNVLAKKYIDAATARFETVQVSTQESTGNNGVTLQVTLNFDCTAEKLIFEMGLSTI